MTNCWNDPPPYPHITSRPVQAVQPCGKRSGSRHLRSKWWARSSHDSTLSIEVTGQLTEGAVMASEARSLSSRSCHIRSKVCTGDRSSTVDSKSRSLQRGVVTLIEGVITVDGSCTEGKVWTVGRSRRHVDQHVGTVSVIIVSIFSIRIAGRLARHGVVHGSELPIGKRRTDRGCGVAARITKNKMGSRPSAAQNEATPNIKLPLTRMNPWIACAHRNVISGDGERQLHTPAGRWRAATAANAMDLAIQEAQWQPQEKADNAMTWWFPRALLASGLRALVSAGDAVVWKAALRRTNSASPGIPVRRRRRRVHQLQGQVELVGRA